MATARVLGILLLAIMLIPHAGAQTQDQKDYISHPGNIPLMTNFSTPQLEPGETGQLIFTLTNRYENDITDVTITVEIYRYANIHESKNLSRVERLPIFTGTRNQSSSETWATIEPDEEKVKDDLFISTRESTEQGTYFVMFQLEFTYSFNNTDHDFVMRSRGHFTDEEWEFATANGTEDDPGNIDIKSLNIDGIIPDTTFGVKKPWPLWPLYLLGTLTVMFAAMAIMSYMYEENTNPRFTRMVHKYQRKLGEDRALIIHELGKLKKKK